MHEHETPTSNLVISISMLQYIFVWSTPKPSNTLLSRICFCFFNQFSDRCHNNATSTTIPFANSFPSSLDFETIDLPYTIGYNSFILSNTLSSWTFAKKYPFLPLAWPNTWIIYISKTSLPILNLWGLVLSCGKLWKSLKSLKGKALRGGFFSN